MRVLPPYGETCTAVFLCAKGVTKHDTPVRGRQNAVPFTALRPPVAGFVPFLPGQLVSGLAEPFTAFSSSRMAFMSMLSTCFWAVSRSISRRHSFGVISSPLAFSSFRYRAPRHRGSAPGCGAARTAPRFSASSWQAVYEWPCTRCTAPTSPRAR